ncbi:heme-binding protein [Halieaceae bacterium IMCC14734]|uniref:Heme-binding protein n=1 Tax=Candidatus Litorirhabdus singularis TaxID=2518993 RepID=A0ABT3TJF3_9GAMM|nr:heme-binding protein [Candidatus Litorirhabdus singularis]MCX2981901.1 heme-binding protein [Candidatus Litorirhabdus singularis]
MKLEATQSVISHQAAMVAVTAALEFASEQGWAISVAVVDSNGRLRAFAQMDGALLISEAGAVRKARTALVGLGSAELATALVADPPAMLAFAQLPDMSLLGGGLPILAQGQVIGAIGVGGASTAEQDVECATAALNYFSKLH